jgi:hypothetical protein
MAAASTGFLVVDGRSTEAGVASAAGLVHVEEDLERLSREVEELRTSLSSEAQSLRRGLATMAEAVHAIRPVLDAEVRHRSETEARLTQHFERQRAEAEARLMERLERSVRDLRAEVSDLTALKARPRLAALERYANECRRHVSSLVAQANEESHRAEPHPVGFTPCGGLSCCQAGCATRCISSGEDLLDVMAARRMLEDTGEALLAQASDTLHAKAAEATEQVAAEAAAGAREVASLRAMAEAAGEAQHLAAGEAAVAEATAVKIAEAATAKVFAAEAAAAKAFAAEIAAATAADSAANAATAAEAAAAAREAGATTQRVELAELERLLAVERESRGEAIAEVLRQIEETNRIATDRIADVSEEGKACLSKALALQVEARAESESRWHTTLQDLQQTFRKDVLAAATSAEKASESSASVQLARTERDLRAEVAATRCTIGEVEKALTSTLNTRLVAGLQETELRRMEMDAELRTRIEAAVGDMGTTAHNSLRRALRPLASEVSSERRQWQASHEELLVSVRKYEQAAMALRDDHMEGLKRVSEEVAGAQEQRHREERGLWTKVHELTRTLRERLPQERRELLEATEQSLDRGLDRRITEVRDELRTELRTRIDSQCHGVRGELQRVLSLQVDAQAKQALVKVDGCADRRLEELLRHQESHSHRQAELSAEQVAASSVQVQLCANEAAQAMAQRAATTEQAVLVSEKLTRKVAATVEEQHQMLAELAGASKDQQEALQHLSSESQQKVDEVQEELRAFMGEQRVFCGFLDAEQKSYHELVRQEVSALSRLVDSTLRPDSATAGVCMEAWSSQLGA